MGVVSIATGVVESMSRYDRALVDPLFRLFLIVLGLAGAVSGLWWLGARLRRVFGLGKPIQLEDLAERRFGGDLRKAQSAVRSAIPAALLILGISAYLIAHGVIGPGREDVQNFLLIGLLAWVGSFGLWRLLERDFAWPGILIPKDVKGTPGMRQVRRQRRGDVGR
jgi:hypothetical protein